MRDAETCVDSGQALQPSAGGVRIRESCDLNEADLPGSSQPLRCASSWTLVSCITTLSGNVIGGTTTLARFGMTGSVSRALVLRRGGVVERAAGSQAGVLAGRPRYENQGRRRVLPAGHQDIGRGRRRQESPVAAGGGGGVQPGEAELTKTRSRTVHFASLSHCAQQRPLKLPCYLYFHSAACLPFVAVPPLRWLAAAGAAGGVFESRDGADS
ncbi:hypothetical protein HPB50_021228 [Hyalomma asiaticum]|uniref:Uncharacterized protein n=1 Tax=Hyalomma asiaticum TaxID=266040 RepID=A0ACB7S1P5_HYAAI|nr:hypothetical protein HPB50_021228 [Hyalomma asiaticum]